jgi:broad specificity phosphatase PhoE
MKLVLVRHGRPDEGHAQRPQDPPLNDEGRAQARAVAEHLADEGITRIVASPLLRAQQTAAPLAARLGLRIETDDGWAEADRGVARYRSTETLRAQGDAEWQRFLADPAGYFGIDDAGFRGGVVAALQALSCQPDRDAHVAVFAHGLPINVVLSHVLGLQRIVHFAPGYGSITRLRIGGHGAIAVHSVNEMGHHPKALRTA